MNASWCRVFNVTTTSTSGALDGLGPAAAARPRGTASRAAERTRRPLLKRKIVPGTGATLSLRADVAELVGAHGSGPCGRKPVEVQVLSSALFGTAATRELRALRPRGGRGSRGA